MHINCDPYHSSSEIEGIIDGLIEIFEKIDLAENARAIPNTADEIATMTKQKG